jgi:protein gp37
MGEKTGISWCDHTFNSWIGCAKVSPGCANCYAERDNNRYGWVDGWGLNGERRKTSISNWKKPLAWNRAAKLAGVRRKVFCASLADVFEDRQELIEWREDLFNLIEQTEYLDWLLLTKRPENIIKWYGISNYPDEIRDNVWIGVTAENQEMADKRIPLLLEIPARVRFISCEPLLSVINIDDAWPWDKPFKDGIHWIIAGGESGSNDRPMNLEWARSLRDQCKDSGTPYFFKQVGGTRRIAGHWGGDLLDGVQHHEFPK